MKKKKIHIDLFNLVVLIAFILSAIFLGHDLFIWGIKPIFTGDYICYTYTGLVFDAIAFFMLEASTQIIEEWF